MTKEKETNGAPIKRAGGQPTMVVLFLSNLLIGFLWATVVPLFGWPDFEIGLLIGWVVLSIVNRDYGRRSLHLISFIFYVLWEIIVSNVSLAWTILQPKAELDRRLNPGIVEVPISLTHDLEILLLASVITLTPGTISVDLGKNTEGKQVLYVHCLRLADKETFLRSIKEGFEARIIRFTQGVTA